MILLAAGNHSVAATCGNPAAISLRPLTASADGSGWFPNDLMVMALTMMIALVVILALWQRQRPMNPVVESNIVKENQNVKASEAQ